MDSNETCNKNFSLKIMNAKMYGNKVGMEETQEYNYPALNIYTSLLIPISTSYWPHKLHSPLRESITLVLVMQ